MNIWKKILIASFAWLGVIELIANVIAGFSIGHVIVVLLYFLACLGVIGLSIAALATAMWLLEDD